MIRAWPLAALALLLLAGAARGASLDARDDNNQPRYDPFALTVRPGETVTLSDVGEQPHTMTSVDGAWPALDVKPGQSANLTAPSTPGDYRFYCAYHASPQTQPGQGMAGVLHVSLEAGNATGNATGSPGSSGTGPAGAGPAANGSAPQRTPDLGLAGLLAALALGLAARRKA
jgi:plastocyanin